jgi:ArsR family transcriptional regulator, arsenate/arsenite/antimonite-responsive transcriptional repressor
MREFVRAAQALSDETRVRILNLLSYKECCVCEVMQAMEISQTRASRNLKILNDAGFLNMRTEGLFTLYVIKQSFSQSFFVDLLCAVKDAVKTNILAKQDIARLKKAKRIGVDQACACK